MSVFYARAFSAASTHCCVEHVGESPSSMKNAGLKDTHCVEKMRPIETSAFTVSMKTLQSSYKEKVPDIVP